MADLLSFHHWEPRPALRSTKCLMQARTAALHPSPPQVYQEMISLHMEKLGVASKMVELLTAESAESVLSVLRGEWLRMV